MKTGVDTYCTLFIYIYFRNEKEVVDSLDEIYSTGTFVQISEMFELGQKLRMIVMGHRRIKISRLLTEEELKAQEVEQEKANRKGQFISVVF